MTIRSRTARLLAATLALVALVLVGTASPVAAWLFSSSLTRPRQ